MREQEWRAGRTGRGLGEGEQAVTETNKVESIRGRHGGMGVCEGESSNGRKEKAMKDTGRKKDEQSGTRGE